MHMPLPIDPGFASDCMLRRGKKIASGVGASERGILQLRLRRYVLLRGQFPLVRVLSKWTQLRVGAAVLPRAALSVSTLFTLYGLPNVESAAPPPL